MTSWGKPFPSLTWYWSPGAALLFAHRPCGESSPCLHCAAQRFGGGRGLLTLQHFAKQWGLLIWEKSVSRAENEQWWRWYIQLSGHLWKQQFGVAGSSRHSHPEGHKPLLSPGAQELLQTCCSVHGVLGMVWSLLPWDPVWESHCSEEWAFLWSTWCWSVGINWNQDQASISDWCRKALFLC